MRSELINLVRGPWALAAAFLSVAMLAGCGGHSDRQTSPAPVAGTAGASSTVASAPDPAVAADGWRVLFDETRPRGWHVTDFAGHGEVRVERGRLILESGASLTGVHWTNPVPQAEYEIQLEANKIEGSDFFCGLTVPVGTNHCTFIVGGWGGAVVGISSIDNQDASENETTKFMNFPTNRWYRIGMQVRPKRIVATIDNEVIVDLDTTDRKISMRFGEIELSQPLGIATYQTTAAIRNVRWRPLPPANP